MSYNVSARDTWECVCTHCGKRHKSTQLCFDFTEVFKRAVPEYFAELKDMLDSTAFIRLMNNWTNCALKPTMLSAEEILQMTPNRQKTGASGVEVGTLTVPAEAWKKKLEEFQRSSRNFKADEHSLLQRMIVQLGQFGPNLIQEELHIYQEGKGDLRVSSVKTADGELKDIRYCPRCGGAMSYWAGRFPELVLTVIGGPRISKSSALAACADFFQKRGHLCGITWTGSHLDPDWNSFREHYLNPYSSNLKVQPTEPNLPTIPHFSVNICIGGDRNLVLTVVDLPGEYDTRADEQVRLDPKIHKQYEDVYQSVDCVWFCTDDVELDQINITGRGMEKVREDRGYDEGRLPTPTEDRNQKLALFASRFKTNVPTVFLLGKCDCLDEENQARVGFSRGGSAMWHDCNWIIPQENQPPILRGQRYHEKALNLREFLMERNKNLISNFEEVFPAHTYIATSNYGHPVQNGGSVNADGLEPFQTELPFLWMLAVKGLLPVKDEVGECWAKEATRNKRQYLAWQNLCMFKDSKECYFAHVRPRFLRR